MRILVIDRCNYTRSGITGYLQETMHVAADSAVDITEAPLIEPHRQYDILLINLSEYCQLADDSTRLRQFLLQFSQGRIYAYLERSYIENGVFLDVMPNCALCSKSLLIPLLEQVRFRAKYRDLEQSVPTKPLFSTQELLIMHSWMAQMPTHLLAKRLDISYRTVYVHKRNIMQKMQLRTRQEFYFIYQAMKYLLPTATQLPLRRLRAIPPTVEA